MPSSVRVNRGFAATFSLISAVSLIACGSSKKSAVPPSCPPSASIASIMGTTVGAPRVTRTTVSLSCLYQPDGGGFSVSVNQSNLTVSQFQAAQAAGASAFHQSPTPVAGYGRAAYIQSANGATFFGILTGSDLVTITGKLSTTEAESLAHYVLAHLPGATGT